MVAYGKINTRLSPNNTIATTHTEYCVALCNNKGGHSLPWSQPNWIHQWIIVIDTVQMEAVEAHGYPSTTSTLSQTQSQSLTLSVSVTESVSVTSVRAMCLYLDNNSISTNSENELVYLPSGDTDQAQPQLAHTWRLRL